MSSTPEPVPSPVETGSASKPVTWLFAGGLALSGLLSGTATTAPIAEPRWRYVGGWTSTARMVSSGPVGEASLPSRRRAGKPASADSVGSRAAATATDARAERTTQTAEMRWLHEASGLTWEQLGRMFGVSRRAVHLWANGGRMNASNAEVLGQVVAVVRDLSGGPDERRAALLAPGADGSSILDRFRARHRSDSRDVSGTPFRPEELLGARRDDMRQP